jgi:hypothetical protein
MSLLGDLKRRIALMMKHAIVGAPLPLNVQTWAIEQLLPMDPWPKSLAYQQCLANRILKTHGAVVQAGPFKGMICIRDADEGCLVPKLLGCYEEELAQVVENFIGQGFERVIDVGCASGYWLTGFALRLSRAEVLGFDVDNEALARCSEINALNNVQSRVMLLGHCTPADLQKHIKGRTLVFMDCDGPEYELLDPQSAPGLCQSAIIVECHDFLNPKITPTLEERFRTTHSIERLSSEVRQPSSDRYPGLKALPPAHWVEALAERRPCVQQWLVMRPKQAPVH